MNIVLLANIVSLIGCCIMVIIGLLKTKRQMLLAQVLQFIFLGTANLMLGGVTAFWTNMISIGRNLYSFRFNFGLIPKLVFILIQVPITLAVNTQGLLGWIPFVGTVVFTWVMDTKNEIVMKAVIIGSEMLWAIYDFTLMNYTGMTFDILTVISSSIGIFIILRDRKKSRKED